MRRLLVSKDQLPALHDYSPINDRGINAIPFNRKDQVRHQLQSICSVQRNESVIVQIKEDQVCFLSYCEIAAICAERFVAVYCSHAQDLLGLEQ